MKAIAIVQIGNNDSLNQGGGGGDRSEQIPEVFRTQTFCLNHLECFPLQVVKTDFTSRGNLLVSVTVICGGRAGFRQSSVKSPG